MVVVAVFFRPGALIVGYFSIGILRYGLPTGSV